MQYEIPAGVKCPLWRRECRKVCPTCRWFKLVRGRNPNTGENVDTWDCAISFLPVLQIETSQCVRSSAAATESFRNEVVDRADRADAVQRALRLAKVQQLIPPPLLIEGNGA
jgi:hypothetical protein